MDAPTTVHDWIDRWEQRDLLGVDLAETLRDDARSVGDDDRPLVERALDRAGSGVRETLGYLGAAFSIGAAGVALDVGSWPEPAIVALLGAVAVLGSLGVVLLTPASSGRAGRLASVSGVAAVVALATALGMTVPDPERTPLLVGLPALGLAGWLYTQHRTVLLHLALGAAAAGSAITAGATFSTATRTIEVVGGIVLAVAATAWIVLSERRVLEQQWLGTLAGGAMTHVGIAMATSAMATGTFEAETTLLVALGVALAHTVVGAVTDRTRVIVVGAAALTVVVPATCIEVLGWSETTTAVALLPVGVALTAWALVQTRRAEHA